MSVSAAFPPAPTAGRSSASSAVPGGPGLGASRRPPSIGRNRATVPADAAPRDRTAVYAGRALVNGANSAGTGAGSRGSSLGRPSGQPCNAEYPGGGGPDRTGREASPSVAARGPAYGAGILGSVDSLQALVDGQGTAPAAGGVPLRSASGCPAATPPAGPAVRPHGQASRNSRRGREDSQHRTGQNLDFDEEARKLWARLNLDPSIVNNGPYNAMDPLWRHPETGGIFYVGNQTAAASLDLLQKHQVTHVVNCTDSMPLYHEKAGGNSPIRYHRFDITSHYRRVRTDEEAVAFAQPMLDFVSAALAEGKNVMAHCLAGAHRAGTTGCICLMHFADLGARDAVPIAKRCRPIIDPIGDFPELLAKLERGWRARGAAGRSPHR